MDGIANSGDVQNTTERSLAGENKMSRKKRYFNLKKGKLHKDLGVPEDKKLTQAEKEKAAHSDNPHLRKEGQFALNAEKFKHGK